MSLWTHIKEAFRDYLERMALKNKELFGDSRPDCCKLNGKDIKKKTK
jgi:hypothetical protein